MKRIPEALIKKYSMSGPRYTSYPTAPMWKEINEEQQVNWLTSNKESKRPVSLYVHIPFCWERCTYCGCNVLVTKQQWRSDNYVDFLLKEIDHLSTYISKDRKIRQLHFGGGTPTFLLDHEFEKILQKIRSYFEFETNAEIAIEVDPCSTRENQLEFLAGLGFNRMSLGVQDFDLKVQEAVNRVQSRDVTQSHLERAKKNGFKGVNFDLIYGLPFQTVESFNHTIDTVIEMKPDRLALYNFAYLPAQMPHQRKIDFESLPDEDTKLEILFLAIEKFSASGYNYIGMDHFALEQDELSIAQKNRTLYRNFMGYTPKSGVDLFGIGASSIAEFGPYFIQNEKKVKEYQGRVEENGISGSKGLELSEDDLIRKWTITRLICHFYLSFDEFKQEFGKEFNEYFKNELNRLEEFQQDGLLELSSIHIQILDFGKILVRNICMIFDAYLEKEDVPKIQYSRTI